MSEGEGKSGRPGVDLGDSKFDTSEYSSENNSKDYFYGSPV